MNVGCRQKHVNAWVSGSTQSIPGTLDIGAAGPRQSGNDGPPDDRGDCPHRFEVAVGSDGKPGLNDVNAKTVKLLRKTQLFLVVHAATGRLFSVAQGRVENGNTTLFHI